MKKTITNEIDACDVCESTNLVRVCMNCGRALCYDHSKTEGVDYSQGVWCGGSGDGFYCLACDDLLKIAGTDALHQSYVAIAALIAESNAWNKEFTHRANAAQKRVEALYRAREAAGKPGRWGERS